MAPSIDEISKELYRAAEAGQVPQVRAALAQGAQLEWISRDGWTPLMTACVHHAGKCEEVVRALLEARANPDFEDERGRTPIFWASHEGLTGVLRMLLQAGASKVHTSDGHGVSALNHATRQNHVEVVRELLAARADPHQADSFGGTAMKEAGKMTHPRHADMRRLHGHGDAPAPPISYGSSSNYGSSSTSGNYGESSTSGTSDSSEL